MKYFGNHLYYCTRSSAWKVQEGNLLMKKKKSLLRKIVVFLH
ncbi:unnamed protein product [Timema podura]|uniref:Uncharacterized protein n=1 Tax=Timema podura TaxID=61482 RepID=A0ABN7NUG6_TIMPD|nr:unnamed protein product [Timema podura]